MKTQSTHTPLLIKSAGGQHDGGDAAVVDAITTFSKAANTRIDETAATVKDLKDQVSGVKAQLTELEQKAVRRPGGDASDEPAAESVGATVLKNDDIGLLASGSKKSVLIGIKGFAVGQKAAITSADTHAQALRDPEIYGPLARRMAVRDLLVTRPIQVDTIEYLVGTRTGSAAIQAAEGDQKSELGITTELRTEKVRTIAAFVSASRQALDDTVMLKDYVDMELLDALQLSEDAQLLKGSGTGSNLKGLWTQAVAYNRSVTGDTPPDTLRRAITQVQLARGVATGIVINPVGLELLELDKDLEGRYMMAYTVTDNNGRTVSWRVPVVVTDALGEAEFMVGDFSRAARLYDRQQATVEVSTQHADYFTRNLVAILAEERLALAVMRPDMLVKGTLTAP